MECTVPTIEDIRKLALHNPTLHVAIEISSVNGLTWEKTMMFAVKCLVAQNKVVHEDMVKLLERYGNPSFIG